MGGVNDFNNGNSDKGAKELFLKNKLAREQQSAKSLLKEDSSTKELIEGLKSEEIISEIPIVTLPGENKVGEISNNIPPESKQDISQVINDNKQEIPEKQDPPKKPSSKQEKKELNESRWNNLDTFLTDVPEVEYAKKTQRITDRNNKIFNEISSRTGIPSVVLVNHVLSCFVENFKDQIDKKYPAFS